MPPTAVSRRRWDVVATLAFVLAGAAFCVVAGVMSLWASFAFEACAEGGCDRSLGDAAYQLGVWGPTAVLGLLLVALLVRVRRRRRGWPLALVALALQSALLAVSWALVSLALTGPHPLPWLPL
ncbi:hypothetical protein [Homoserinibacter sp. YIM 151385]|uniref:hypothetical protein n=1 Tax=Homoserinibacter sp. YIM 151385 TaxID=2985506 RepID=UPI0022F05EA8|nr:hypothetical protein [Homoserinibacter sp. YIM 151385]WBU37145.1 hypothetical protein OF852_09440 [Homoserinibacter sp. YIM 151385]